jgi:hypothetical protein
MRSAVVAGAVGFAAVTCTGADRDSVVGLSGTGVVKGFVYFDANGTGSFDPFFDPGLPGVRVRLFPSGSRELTAQATSGVDGLYRLPGIPVGDYVAVVDSATVGDSARVVGIELGEFTLRPGDSVLTLVGVSFPTVTVAEARALPAGRPAFVRGLALNSSVTFGDSTVHLADTSGAIRVSRVIPGVLLLGDSARVLGLRTVRDGQPVLEYLSAFPFGQPGAPIPELVSTALAQTADGGRLDAALVKISDATIMDTATIERSPFPDDYEAIVDDGSGPVTVVFDGDASLTVSTFVPGARIDATGVLVPTVSGPWRLKPRVNFPVPDVVLR